MSKNRRSRWLGTAVLRVQASASMGWFVVAWVLTILLLAGLALSGPHN